MKSEARTIAAYAKEHSMTKPEKLTVVLEPETRDRVVEWAHEEGRSVSNLLRRLIDQACGQRQRRAQAGAVEAAQ